MKKQLISLSVLTALSVSTAWAAAPTANLLIKGDIVPPTCTVNGGDNELTYDLGTLSPGLIPKSDVYEYPNRLERNFTVTCDAATFLSFSATDTYDAAELKQEGRDGTNWFHLVNKADTSKSVGGVTFFWINNFTKVDDKKAFIKIKKDVPGGLNYADIIKKEAVNAWVGSDSTSADLIAGKVFESQIVINNVTGRSAYIKSRDDLTKDGIAVDEGIEFQGEVVMTFNFGL